MIKLNRLLLIGLASFALIGQSFAHIFELALGNYTFAYPPAKPLVNRMSVKTGVTRYSFVGSVGGVAFGSIASSADGSSVVSLSYDGTKPDGQRLVIGLRSGIDSPKSVTAYIYDWELIPLANFADQSQHACFTLFGELQDPNETKSRRTKKHEILNYHPAFQDTLMGLRLFQSDVLILYPEACGLPKDGGAYVLGKGEAIPSLIDNLANFNDVGASLNQGGGPFQSYVICDVGVPIQFSSAQGELTLTGQPYWYCWKLSSGGTEDAATILQNATSEANRILAAEYNRDKAAMTVTAFNLKYSASNQRRRQDALFDSIASRYVISMPGYSQALSNRIAEMNGVNPAVYAATTTAMRYTAFFRNVKANRPDVFKSFVGRLKGVSFGPKVKTPTVLIRK